MIGHGRHVFHVFGVMGISAIEQHGRAVGKNKERLFPHASMYEMDIEFARSPFRAESADSVAANAPGDNRSGRACSSFEKSASRFHIRDSCHNQPPPRFLPPPKST
jgi:hypothetical protein